VKGKEPVRSTIEVALLLAVACGGMGVEPSKCVTHNGSSVAIRPVTRARDTITSSNRSVPSSNVTRRRNSAPCPTLKAAPQVSAPVFKKESPKVSRGFVASMCGSVASMDVSVSTLSVPPSGSEVVSQHDPIWVFVSQRVTKTVTFANDSCESKGEQSSVDKLMVTAKDELCKKAKMLGCNAVLGMTMNVSKDSCGQRGASKDVSLTMMGTPCVLSGPGASKDVSLTMAGTPCVLSGPSSPGPSSPTMLPGGDPFGSGPSARLISAMYGSVEDVAFTRVQSLAQDYVGTAKEGCKKVSGRFHLPEPETVGS